MDYHIWLVRIDVVAVVNTNTCRVQRGFGILSVVCRCCLLCNSRFWNLSINNSFFLNTNYKEDHEQYGVRWLWDSHNNAGNVYFEFAPVKFHQIIKSLVASLTCCFYGCHLLLLLLRQNGVGVVMTVANFTNGLRQETNRCQSKGKQEN